MSAECGSLHPQKADTVCARTSPNHKQHIARDGTSWDNEVHVPLPRKVPKRGGRAGTGRAIDDFLNGPDRDWVQNATETVTTWLRHNSESFTTAEAFWPMLDAPRDLRLMSRVVQHLLDSKHMEEVDSIRLKGTYTTRDGEEFKENKLVPVYRSRIVT